MSGRRGEEKRGEKRARKRAAREGPGGPPAAPGGTAASAKASGTRFAWITSPVVLAVAVVAAIGVALRMWRIGSGLPDFLDEAIPWKTALRMWVDERRVDWNPHFFNYPSLTIYLCLFLQKLAYLVGRMFGRYSSAADFLMDYELDPTALVIVARTMGVLCDLVTIVTVARIGERLARWAGVAAAAVVALSPTMIATSRAIYTDSYMAVFAVLALERMLAYRAGGRAAPLVAATVLSGLAAGAKYPGALLVIPLAWVIVEREGARGSRTWALAALAALGVFLITSPFVVLDFGRFVRDFTFESFHMSSGHLGSGGRRAFLFQLQALARDIGWLGVALLAVSLVRTALAPRRRGDGVALWLFLLPLGLAVSLARVEAGRYLTPVVPVAAALAAAAGVALARPLAAWPPLASRVAAFRPAATPEAVAATIAALGLALPVIPGGVVTAWSGRDDTQAQARRWCEANILEPSLIVQEGYTASLYTRRRAEGVQRSRGFRLASAERQKRVRERHVFDAADLPLFASGHSSTVLVGADGQGRRMPVFAEPADVNQIFYDLRLLHGVDYVLTSAATRGRFEADTVRFAIQRIFYRFLDRRATRVASFSPGRGVSGPRVDIYRIEGAARQELVRMGMADALWWARYVPREFREGYEAQWVAPELRTGGTLVNREGELSPWLTGLGAFFEANVAPYARLLAWELSYFGRFAPAAPLLEAIHLMEPGNASACIAFTRCAAALERWDRVGSASQKTMGLVKPDDPAFPELRYMRALALARFGRRDEALGELDWVVAHAAPGSGVRSAAEAEAGRIRGSPR